MVNVSGNRNAYADKIFAENPTAIWALDDSLTETPVALSTVSSVLSAYGNGIPAKTYGFDQNSNLGYYVSGAVSNNGIPMVYGSLNVTTLYPNSVTNAPSLVIPGFGFLTENHRYNAGTFQFWLRITDTQHYPRRLFGQVNSMDGLYLDGPFLSLRIGDNVGSHYLGDIGRPMLISIVYINESVTLIVNDKEVVNVKFKNEDTALSTNSGDSDWVAFYSYSTTPRVQIDTIAYYPTAINSSRTKLHYTWGQAVDSPELNNSSYTDVPVIADYQFAKNANNFMYPSEGRWQNGLINNVSTDGNMLSVPAYTLPSIVFSDSSKTVADWYDAQELIVGQSMTTSLSNGVQINPDSFFQMNPIIPPTGSTQRKRWTTGCVGVFEKLNFIQDTIESFFIVVKADQFTYDFDDPTDDTTEFVETLLAPETLFKMVKQSGDYLEAEITYPAVGQTTATVAYKFNGTTIDSFTVEKNDLFAVGLNFSDYATYKNNPALSGFLGDRQSIKFYFGGNESLTKTYSGSMYRVSFSNGKNDAKVSSKFTNGMVDKTKASDLKTWIASYTLFPSTTYGSFGLDIAVEGTWSDHVPAKKMATSKVLANNVEVYTLDYLQLNLDYPESTSTTNSFVKSYIRLSNTAAAAVTSFTDMSIESDRTITIGSGWESKRYEFVDYTIAELPTGLNLETTEINIDIDFTVAGIIRRPVSIKTLHVSSHVFNESSEKTSIGTKLGKDIYPYSIVGGNTVYDGGKPVLLYKNSTPYLYLNKNSGFRIPGSDDSKTFGLEIPINESLQPFYRMSVLQFALYTDYSDFSNSVAENEILQVNDGSDSISVRLAYGTGNYGKIKVYMNGSSYIDQTVPAPSIGVYMSGTKTDTGFRSKEWHMVTLLFRSPVDFKNGGNIRITGKHLVNSISDFQISETRVNQNYSYDQWSKVLGTVGSYKKWSDYDTETTWAALLNQQSLNSDLENVSLDPIFVYRTYVGRNIEYSNVLNGYLQMELKRYSFYTGIVWDEKMITPV